MRAPHDDELGPMRVTLDEDGLTILMPLSRDGRPVERDALTVGLTPLGDDRHSVIWFSEDRRELFDGQSPYGLLIREERDLFRIAFPACEATEALARAGGAEVNSNETRMTCRFSSRRDLETSLLSYAPDADEDFRLTPVRRE